MTWEYEERAWANGYGAVCGVDEAGRGPVAGPVCAAAVILPAGIVIEGLNDSKKLSEKKREKLFDEITGNALAWSVSLVDERVIDEINILEATKEAMTEAVRNADRMLCEKRGAHLQHLLIDALTLKTVTIPQTGIVKGDAASLSIAAASIIAKVTRDRMMVEYDRVYPGYGFEKNKGYGTKAHYEGLHAQGMTPIHRRSFLKNL